MKRIIALLMIVGLTSTSFAHSVKYMRKMGTLNLGMQKSEVLKIMGAPDYSMGTLKGIEILGYNINRYRSSDEKGELAAIGIFTAGLGFFGVFFPPSKTYCLTFNNMGELMEWRALDNWIDDDIRTIVKNEY